MEAKDTVSYPKLDEVYKEWLKDDGATAGDLQVATAQAQAEISFKVGRQSGILDMEKQVADAYEGGLKEVVEWIQSKILATDEGECMYMRTSSRNTYELWQAFKKRKRIEK